LSDAVEIEEQPAPEEVEIEEQPAPEEVEIEEQPAPEEKLKLWREFSYHDRLSLLELQISTSATPYTYVNETYSSGSAYKGKNISKRNAFRLQEQLWLKGRSWYLHLVRWGSLRG